MKTKVSRSLRALVPAVGGLAVLAFVFPAVTGSSWGTTFQAVRVISLLDSGLLAAVWIAGLCSYTLVLRASLPGLSLPRALALNLGGSAVSNLLPFGGAAGLGLNFAMARSWGFRRSSFATFTALTTIVNVAAKLVLPIAVALAVALSGQIDSPSLTLSAEISGVLLAVAILVVGVGVTGSARRRRGGRLEPAGSGLRRRADGLLLRAATVLAETWATARLGWHRICLGMLGYLTLQAMLLWLIFTMLHSGLSVIAIVAGFALERVLTLAVVTPGGVGIAQTGAAAALIAFGGAPATVAAGVLVYSGFTFFLEIPVGAAATLGWWVLDRSTRRVAGRG